MSKNEQAKRESDTVRFLSDESELSGRLRSAIGDEAKLSFARRADVAESVLRKYLNGAMPSTDRLVRLADAAGVSIEWLATGKGPRKRPITVEVPPGSAAKLYTQPMKQALLDIVIKAVSEAVADRPVTPAAFMELVAVAYPLAQSGITHEQLVQVTKAAIAR